MNDYLQVLEGTDDPQVLLRAARFAIRGGMRDSTSREIIDLALNEFGPETVYMDGELFSSEY